MSEMKVERISDENLNEWNEFLDDQDGEYDIGIDCQVLKMIVKELKEKRETDKKPLDIKQQVKLIHDKCPDVWKKTNNIEIIMDVVRMEYEEAIKESEERCQKKWKF